MGHQSPDIFAAKQEVQRTLGESEARFRALFEGAGMCIMIVSLEGRVLESNAAAEKILGYPRAELFNMMTLELIHPDDVHLGMDLHGELLKGHRNHYQTDKRYIRKDGKAIWGRLTISLVRNKKGDPRFYIAIIDDITERRLAVEALQKRESELKVQAQAMEEVNVALRVLLKRRENDQREMEEKVLANAKEFVSPFIQQLKKTKLDSKQLGYLNIIESNINEIISPFSGRLSAKFLALTPKEIQVANLIKVGKNSKDIAALLNVSVRAIDFHRGNLRKKVGLKNEKANLRSYLMSLT